MILELIIVGALAGLAGASCPDVEIKREEEHVKEN